MGQKDGYFGKMLWAVQVAFLFWRNRALVVFRRALPMVHRDFGFLAAWGFWCAGGCGDAWEASSGCFRREWLKWGY